MPLSNYYLSMKTTGNSRPFGVSLIVAGIDRLLGPQLYLLDTDGTVNAWNAVCVGRKSDDVMEGMIDLFTSSSEEKGVGISEIWPAFETCLRKHFPNKPELLVEEHVLSQGAERVSQSIPSKDTGSNESDGIIEGSSNLQPTVKPTGSIVGSSLLGTLYGDVNENIEDYWDFEVKTIMLNSDGEISIAPLIEVASSSLEH